MSNPPRPLAKFLTGSTLKHVLTMTATGSVGLMSVFAVDAISLFYITRLGKQELTAALSFAGTLMFFLVSVSIGFSIAAGALTSRALGQGDRDGARRNASAALVLSAMVMGILVLTLYLSLAPLLTLLGAKDEAARQARSFMMLVLPSIPLLGLGMTSSSLLRALGDAKRSMWVTLFPAISLLALDPLFIFGLGLELNGAAVATNLARIFMVSIGMWQLIKVHRLLVFPSRRFILKLLRPFLAIGGPAVLTQIATPFANAWVTSALAKFGDDAVAGGAIISRITPMAFGAIFAMSGSIGPIIGQNFGAKRLDRVRSTLNDSMKVTLVYCLLVSFGLAVFAEPIASAFGAHGQAYEVVVFFCVFIAATFVFSGIMFVANSVFNNLGFALYSTALNWGRCTLGVLPFVWLGGYWFGAKGVVAGSALGSIIFGLLALWLCYRVVAKLDENLG